MISVYEDIRIPLSRSIDERCWISSPGNYYDKEFCIKMIEVYQERYPASWVSSYTSDGYWLGIAITFKSDEDEAEFIMKELT